MQLLDYIRLYIDVPHCTFSPQVSLSEANRRAAFSDEEARLAERRLMDLQAAADVERQRQAERQVAHLQASTGQSPPQSHL